MRCTRKQVLHMGRMKPMHTRREFMRMCAAAAAAAGCAGCRSELEGGNAVTETHPEEAERTPDLKYVTYCGLYCRHCDIYRTAIARQASALCETLRNEREKQPELERMNGFKEFWAVLEELAQNQSEGKCRGCRGGCGDPDCEIRKCARSRRVEVCSSCADYPCQKIHAFVKKYPHVIGDGMRQKAVGLSKWIEEQEQRYRAGFCFVDLRNPS